MWGLFTKGEETTQEGTWKMAMRTPCARPGCADKAVRKARNAVSVARHIELYQFLASHRLEQYFHALLADGVESLEKDLMFCTDEAELFAVMSNDDLVPPPKKTDGNGSISPDTVAAIRRADAQKLLQIIREEAKMTGQAEEAKEAKAAEVEVKQEMEAADETIAAAAITEKTKEEHHWNLVGDMPQMQAGDDDDDDDAEEGFYGMEGAGPDVEANDYYDAPDEGRSEEV